MKSRLRCVLILTVLGLAGLVALDFGATVDWVGDFPLRVHLSSAKIQLYTHISAAAISGDDTTIASLQGQNPFPIDELIFRPIRDIRDESFIVDVSCAGKASGLGRELSYGQYRVLILKLDYAGGESKIMLRQIPDGRKCRKLTVEVN